MKRALMAIVVAIAALMYVIVSMKVASSRTYPREYRDVYEQMQMERMITG